MVYLIYSVDTNLYFMNNNSWINDPEQANKYGLFNFMRFFIRMHLSYSTKQNIVLKKFVFPKTKIEFKIKIN